MRILTIINRLKPAQWLLIAIFLIAALLRLYNLPGTMMFLGDQGRDAIIVKRIFKDFDPVFIGPVTSVGNLYLGPLYYYFMVPFLWLTYPSPVGPTYGVAILGIITVFLMYKLGRELIGSPAALIATSFLALSSTVINNTRFSWNPNPAPLVSLLMVYFTYQAWKKNPKYWLLVTVLFSVIIQLHYLTLLSAAGAGLVLLWQIYDSRKNWGRLRQLLVIAVASIAIFVTSLTPLILFDLKHDNLNAKAFTRMFTGEDNFKQNAAVPLPEKIATIVKETHGRGMHILFEISIGKHRTLNTGLLILTLVVISALVINPKKWQLRRPGFGGETVVFAYLITGIIGTAFYGHTVFDHYIAYLFPITFLTFGIVIRTLTVKVPATTGLTAIFGLAFLAWNLPRYQLQTQNWSLDDVHRTANTILTRVKPGDKYNIVLLSETGDIDGQSYRYFLEVSSSPPLAIENRGQAEMLFIINEDKKLAKVTDSPVYEIVVFPDKTPKEVYNVEGGPEITVLKK